MLPTAPAQDARTLTLAGELRVLVGQFKRRFREQASPGDFTPSQVSIILRLERHGPATVSTLARAEAMRPQSMGATVSVLETAGLIQGTPDPGDGRQTLLSLTPTCQEWLHAGRAAREDWLYRSIHARLTSPEQAELASAVELLKRLVEP